MMQGENITLELGGKTILRDINLEISSGEFALILGPNGAGKSTLLKVLALLIKPSAGRVLINGGEAREQSQNIKRRIGFLSHRSFLYDRLTAWENLKFYGHLFQVPNLAQRVESMVDQVGLSLFLHEPVSTYSRGMVQRLAIARAMLHDPDLLFLDEPFTGLDQKGGEILTKMIGEMHRRGKTILMVTHNLDQDLNLADRVLILKNGAKIYDHKVSQLGADLKDVYLSQVGNRVRE